MRRIASLALLLLLGSTLAVAMAPAAGAVTNTPTFNSPASNDHIANVTVDYSLPDAVLAGSVRLTFTGPTNCTLTLTDAPTANFSLPLGNLSSSSHVVSSTCGNAISDGNYMITISYRNAAADPPASATITNVELDAVTAAPVVTTPASSTTYPHSLPVQYSLPESPLAGSVRLVFSGSTSCTLTMNDSTTANFTLDTTSLLTAPSVVSSTCGATLPDGAYTVVAAYQNSVGAPAATATRTSVVIAAALPTTTTTASSATTSSTTTTMLGRSSTTTSAADPTRLQPTTTVDASGVAGAGLAATGADALPQLAFSIGIVLVGLGLLLLRPPTRRRR